MCQPMPTGLYTQWEYDSQTNRFTARQNKSRSFENMVLSCFQQSRPDCKIESNITPGRQNKIDCFSVDGIFYHCSNTVFEAVGYYFHYCPCQKAHPFLTDNDIMRGRKKREPDQMRKKYIQQIGSKSLKCGSAIGENFTELMHQSKVTFRRVSPIKSSH